MSQTIRKRIPFINLLGFVAVCTLGATAAHAADEPSPDKATANTELEADGRLLESMVYFEFDKAELSDKAKAELDEAARWIKSNATSVIFIEGHTDKVGTLAYNKELSSDRAAAAKAYLESQGVEPSQIKMLAYGEALPKVDTKHPSRNNRRIKLIGLDTSPVEDPEPQVVTVTQTETVTVPVIETRTVEKKVYVPGEFPDSEDDDIDITITAGGGVAHALDSDSRNILDTGGMWNVRLGLNTGRHIGVEAAYVGLAQDFDEEIAPTNTSTGEVVANGFEGALKVNILTGDIRPYVLGGLGYGHYRITEGLGDDLSDDVLFVPGSVGVAVVPTEHLLIDTRATVRAAFQDELLNAVTGSERDMDLDNVSATAHIGYQF